MNEPKAEGQSSPSSASVDSGVEKEKDFAHAKAQPTRELPPEETGIAPCPFCGKDARLISTTNGWKVECRFIGACFGNWHNGFQVKDAAIERWNRRSDAATASLLRERDEWKQLAKLAQDESLRIRKESDALLRDNQELTELARWIYANGKGREVFPEQNDGSPSEQFAKLKRFALSGEKNKANEENL